MLGLLIGTSVRRRYLPFLAPVVPGRIRRRHHGSVTWPQRALAAFLAISLRSLAESFLALALPPFILARRERAV